MTESKRQLELDLLRIVAAFGIVLYHYTFRGYAADNLSVLKFPVFGGIFKYGYLGVDIFFLLSGYTILASVRQKDFWTFVRARVLRLYPTFWIAVCLTSVVTLFLGDGRFHVYFTQFFANLTMLNHLVGIPWIDGAYWFLAVILRFYFLIALALLFGLLKFRLPLLGGWLALTALLLFWHIPYLGKLFIPSAAPFLIAGMIFYCVKEEGWDRYKIAIGAGAFLLGLEVLLREVTHFTIHYHASLSPWVLGGFLLGLYGCLILFSHPRFSFTPSSGGERLILVISAATYPLYLLHQNAGYMIFNHLGGILNRYLLLSLTVAGMVLTSVAIVLYIEPVARGLLDQVLRAGAGIITRREWRHSNGYE